MHSIRTKITALSVCALVIVMVIITTMATISIRNLGNTSANQILFFLCEDGQKNLDNYFSGIEQAVETISDYAEADLKNTDIENLGSHLDRVSGIFEKMANNTHGILTYYYRIDPTVAPSDKGFWYINVDGNGFKEHDVTDITRYDTDDQSKLVWFTVPKATGKAVWLPPYFTDNLDAYVFSYNVPIKKDGRFVGVIGIEIDYNTIANQVKNIELYDNGYAFVNDTEGNIICHPRMSMDELIAENKQKVPEGLLSDSTYIRYTHNNVEKQAVWLPLINGMRLNVTAPMSEINAHRRRLTEELIIVSLILLIIFIILTMRFSKHITDPLLKLTEAAKQIEGGNYDFELDYNGNDEVGILTGAFNHLTGYMKIYIRDLNDLAYSDPLTSVHNKGAFDIYMRDLQDQINISGWSQEFAIAVFDCNDLKPINDEYGHKFGDMYLKNTVSIICRVFSHSPVFRTGGDEFAVIMQNEDYRNRDELEQLLIKRTEEISQRTGKAWEKISVAVGIAVYDPKTDRLAEDVMRRADALMYENKRRQKSE